MIGFAKLILLGLSLTFQVFGSGLCFNASPDSRVFAMPDQGTLRAISLSQMQVRLSSQALPVEESIKIKQLMGIQRIAGIVIDDSHNDIVIFGWAENHLSSNCLDDFVEMLKNACFIYAPLIGNTYQYSYPGCSIDPNPLVISQLVNIGKSLGLASDTSIANQLVLKWQSTCKEPQTVRILGIPFQNHSAKIMVSADYQMKLIADGTDTLLVPGMKSFTEKTMSKLKYEILNDKKIGSLGSPMNRFWFYPGEILVQEESNAYLLCSCPVKILTEESFLNRNGGFDRGDKADLLAQSFADDFTNLYEKIANERNIYQELENVFRFAAVAKVLYEKDATKFPCIRFLTSDYRCEEINVDSVLPGHAAIQYFAHSSESAEIQLRLPSCGGVSVEIQPKYQPSKSGLLKRIKAAILSDRPSLNSLSWDCNEPAILELARNNRQLRLNDPPEGITALFVSYSHRKYLVKRGDETIYEGSDNIPKMVQFLTGWLEKNKMDLAILIPTEFPNDNKIATFASNVQIQMSKPSMKNGPQLVPINQKYDEKVQAFLEELQSRGLQYSKEEGMSSTQHGKNISYQNKLIFVNRMDHEDRLLSATFKGNKRIVVQDVVDLVKSRFDVNNSISTSLLKLTNDVKKQLAKRRDINVNDLKIILENEFGSRYCEIIIMKNRIVVKLV
jgi:Protein of unknown function (DUF1598).